MENKKKGILMVVQYPEKVSPGQRFRFELYKEVLVQNGFVVTTKSFLDQNGYEIIHSYGNFFKKSMATAKGVFRKVVVIISNQAI